MPLKRIDHHRNISVQLSSVQLFTKSFSFFLFHCSILPFIEQLMFNFKYNSKLIMNI